MIRAGVDHQDVGTQLGGNLGGGAVRQRQEDHVMSREVLGRGVDDGTVRQGSEVLVVLE